MRLLGRLLIGSLALVLAIPCGTAVLVAGVLIDPASREAIGSLGLFGIVSGLEDLAAGLPPDVAVAALAAFARALGILLVLPPVLAATIGETLGLRAVAWYAGATGLLTAALPWVARGGARPPSGQAALAGEGRVMAVLFLAGAVSGLVYWTVAGRGTEAGAPRP